MTVCLIALGCPKNLVDSEHMLGVLGRSGFSLTLVPEQADVIVINTCGFLRSAVAESEQVIGQALKLKEQHKVRKVIVAGCLVQRSGPGLAARLPGIDALVGIDEIRLLPAIVQGKSVPARKTLPSGICRAGMPRLVSTPRHYAYLRIADGCDNRCSYCLIPSIRGRLRSRDIGDIVREAGLLVRNGARELILIAQDTTAYGLDRYGRPMLAQLLRRLGRVDDIEWLRVMYTHPAHFTSELVDEIALNDKTVKYIDLPLQHISDRLLQQMNRPYSRADIEALLARLKQIPNMTIRTTFIAGFPGETAQDFRELCRFGAEGHFAHVGCFAFSPEPSTRACRLRRQVPARIANARAQELIAGQRGQALARNQALVGSEVLVRIDSFADQEYLGRTAGDAPEIDDTVHVSAHGIQIGSLVRVRVTRSGAYDIHGVKS